MPSSALAGWLAIHGAALAQPQKKPPENEQLHSEVYVMAYGLVILGIALGMLFVCRSEQSPRPSPARTVWRNEGREEGRRIGRILAEV